jgi:hypothetical protein
MIQQCAVKTNARIEASLIMHCIELTGSWRDRAAVNVTGMSMPLQAPDLAQADVIIAIDDESANQVREAALFWGQGCPQWVSNKTKVLGDMSDAWAKEWGEEFQRWDHDPLSCSDPGRLFDSLLAASKEICECRRLLFHINLNPKPHQPKPCLTSTSLSRLVSHHRLCPTRSLSSLFRPLNYPAMITFILAHLSIREELCHESAHSPSARLND